MKLGVVGLGFGIHHVRTIVNIDGIELAAVADMNSGAEVGAAYGVPGFEDGVRMMDEVELDGVVVATSPAYRKDLLKACVERNLPALVEKPWAATVAQAEELAALVEGGRVMPAFSFRYLPAIAKLRDLLPDLGRPLAGQGNYVTDWLPPNDWWLWDPERGGGYFNENTCHLFDAVNSVFGKPLALSALASQTMKRPGPDVAVINVSYASGAVVSLAAGGIGAGLGDYPSLRVYCSEGEAALTGKGHIWEGLRWVVRGEDVRSYDPAPEGLGETRYSCGIRAFVEAVRQNAPLPSSVEDGVICVRMAEAITESARTRKEIEL